MRVRHLVVSLTITPAILGSAWAVSSPRHDTEWVHCLSPIMPAPGQVPQRWHRQAMSSTFHTLEPLASPGWFIQTGLVMA
jgi:hypothetical protein